MFRSNYSLKGRHCRSVQDFTPEEMMQILHSARDMKYRFLNGERPRLLEGRTLGMVFQKPSLRTVVSFEVGMNQLGGHALYLGPDQIKINERETTEDIAMVLSGYVDGIMARVFSHKIIEDLAKYSRVPVINGLSDFEHPCQIFGDLLTVLERREELRGLKVVFVGDGNNVANSWALAAARFGMHLVVASPSGFELKPNVMEMVATDARSFHTSGRVEQTRDPLKAVKDADVIYTDVWASMGQESEREERKRLFKGYQLDTRLLDAAKPDVLLMHCLPAHYGEEIAAGMQKDSRSVIFQQAENRLHAQKAILVSLMR